MINNRIYNKKFNVIKKKIMTQIIINKMNLKRTILKLQIKLKLIMVNYIK